MTDNGDNGKTLVVRLVILAKMSKQGNVTALRHLLEVNCALDLIENDLKQNATIKDVQVIESHI